VPAACTARKSPFRLFSVAEARTLAAICEQIIPADQDPGASWAGVVKYIDRQLAVKFHDQIETYRRGIALADSAAGGNFSAAPADRQLETMKRLEKDAKPFFDQVVAHTMQGFYGNPRHGGNREFASWRMLSIPPVPVRGRAQYDFAVGKVRQGS
jgi:gluconate 2-dehydrogenase gamma chain